MDMQYKKYYHYCVYFGLLFSVVMSCKLLAGTKQYDLDQNYNNDCCQDCSEDYFQGIQKMLDRYKRPITLLDVSKNRGRYTCKIAEQYDSVCVIAEQGELALQVCKQQEHLNNLILLNMHFCPAQLRRLGDCEHFDVIIAGDMRKNYGDEWRNAVDALCCAGDHIIIEGILDDAELYEYVCSKGDKIIMEQLCVLRKTTALYGFTVLGNKYLRRKTWLRRPLLSNIYQIESSYHDKCLIKPKSWKEESFISCPWIAGVNLCTFKMCRGAYPTTEQLLSSLVEAVDVNHTDWMINNMVLQGKNIALIDCDDAVSKRFFSEDLYLSHQEIFSLEDPLKVKHYFWYRLICLPVTQKEVVKLFSKLFTSSNVVFDIGVQDDMIFHSYEQCGVTPVQLPVMNAKGIVPNQVDALVREYGAPHFCNIRLCSQQASACLRTLASLLQRANCVAFQFDASNLQELAYDLTYLFSLGYQEFNFSARDIPQFVLSDNKYRKIKRGWAQSEIELIQEIAKFKKLDHDEEHLWGYVYARR